MLQRLLAASFRRGRRPAIQLKKVPARLRLLTLSTHRPLPQEAEDLGALSDSGAPPSEVQQTYVWGTSVNVQECTSNFRRFIANFKLNEWDDEPYYKEKLREMYQQQARLFTHSPLPHSLTLPSRRSIHTSQHPL